MNATGTSFAAAVAASQSSLSPQRKRKHDAAATDSSSNPTKTKLKKSERDKEISEEMFEDMLDKPYGPRKDALGIIKSGKDRRGHTLYFDGGYIYCQA